MKIAAMMIGCGMLLTAGVALAKPPVHNAELVREVWYLRQLEERSVNYADPEAATIRFLTNHRIAGTAACNDVGGDELTWSADPTGAKGTFARNKTGATIITTAGCPNASSIKAGSRFWARMSDAHDWSLSAKILTVEFADGSIAVLAPKTDR